MIDRTRGVLYPARLPTFTRLPPSPAAKHLVDWFWIPEWDISPGRTSRQHVIAFPASNLVVHQDIVMLAGPTTRRSHRDLTGSGWAVGALLRPAAVGALVSEPRELVDAYVTQDYPELHAAVVAAMAGPDPQTRHAAAVEAFSAWIVRVVPTVTAQAHLAGAMADLLASDPSVLRIEDAAASLSVSVRTLQRLARRYVGLTPAAMIRRRRLQEAVQRVREDPGTDLAVLAAELGYCDHAHLTHDFRTVLGFTPSGYRVGEP